MLPEHRLPSALFGGITKARWRRSTPRSERLGARVSWSCRWMGVRCAHNQQPPTTDRDSAATGCPTLLI
jgi:hypothetical protein